MTSPELADALEDAARALARLAAAVTRSCRNALWWSGDGYARRSMTGPDDHLIPDDRPPVRS